MRSDECRDPECLIRFRELRLRVNWWAHLASDIGSAPRGSVRLSGDSWQSGHSPLDPVCRGHRPGDLYSATLIVWLLATTPESPQGPLTEPLDLSLTVKAGLSSA